jgi:hypothetical protein
LRTPAAPPAPRVSVSLRMEELLRNPLKARPPVCLHVRLLLRLCSAHKQTQR